ncbi:MAG TPA: uracil-DNA glycosylase [Myxococcota bacterium]|nr:uracil-DNA glycosylase [Myxococcota bacterium]
MSEWEIELRQSIQMLKVRLNLLKESGMTYIDKTESSEKKIDMKLPLLEGTKMLDNLRKQIGDCQRCKLCHGRKNIVFGSGKPDAKLVFVGEGPGAEEDAKGLPFVGRAGQLLTKMINAMGFSREEIYICNVVKCRPPENRDPEPDEIEACEPFLKSQLSIIKPKVIVGLGRYACQTLLKSNTPMSKLRGHWNDYEGISFMPTFHPAYLLRNPPAKKEVWEDLQRVMAFLQGRIEGDDFAEKG